MSPRQKMINLLYLVLTAMLALNISTDVLDGFELVKHEVDRSADDIEIGNRGRYQRLDASYDVNPVKMESSLRQARELRTRADNLSTTIDSLIVSITEYADGAGGDRKELINRNDREAAAVVMLDPSSNAGRLLREKTVAYGKFVASLIGDSLRRQSVLSGLSLKPDERRLMKEGTNQTWEETTFSQMPALTAVTLLSKLRGDIRLAESEALESLMADADYRDVRVNELEAFVIPVSSMVMSGGQYTADIVMAAVDTTSRPTVRIGSEQLPQGTRRISVPATGTGSHTLSGHIELTRHDGTVERRPFSSSYTVIPPTATVAPLMMNVLYSGIENPIDIAVPGVDPSTITASMTNGSLRRQGTRWTARPSVSRGESVVTVSVETGGKRITVASVRFRVRPLPDPVAYIALTSAKGTESRYSGAPRKVTKSMLENAEGLYAELDGDLPDIKFTVIGFSTVFLDAMGNAMPEVSEGNRFSKRQKQYISRIKSGGSFFISNIRAKGPDGSVRDLSPMQVTVR